MTKVKYEEMLPHEMVGRRDDCPIAYVGLGCVTNEDQVSRRDRRRNGAEQCRQLCYSSDCRSTSL